MSGIAPSLTPARFGAIHPAFGPLHSAKWRFRPKDRASARLPVIVMAENRRSGVSERGRKP
jgi:hypothetical protein